MLAFYRHDGTRWRIRNTLFSKEEQSIKGENLPLSCLPDGIGTLLIQNLKPIACQHNLLSRKSGQRVSPKGSG